jgi:hypothetical protein
MEQEQELRDFAEQARGFAKWFQQQADARSGSAMGREGFQVLVNKELPTPQQGLRSIAEQLQTAAAAIESYLQREAIAQQPVRR